MREELEPTETTRRGWFASARTQGLVCLICHEVPPLEDRSAFFDTGLCVRCSEDLSKADREALRNTR